MKARIPNQGQGVNQAGMMKQIQKMQDEMEQKQKEVQETEFTASAGGGACVGSGVSPPPQAASTNDASSSTVRNPYRRFIVHSPP